MKIDEISTLQENGKYACNICGKEYSKKGISSHYWLNHGDGEEHLNKMKQHLSEIYESNRGRPSWNSGLTSDTDERLMKMRKTIQKRNSTPGYQNPQKGSKVKNSTKEKISESRSKFLNERGNGGFKDVKWYKAVDSFGNECSLRGTWERDVAEWLTHQGIEWSRKYYIKYLDENVNRTYSPDFFIPADNVIIEVKGYYSDRDKRKMSLVKEQHPNISIKMMMKKEIEQLSTLKYYQL
jgi:hypothetical protein